MAHKIQMYENLRDVLEREVKEIERKNDINEKTLDNLYKLTATMKYIDRCLEKEEEKESGASSMDSGYSNARGGRGSNNRGSYGGMSMEAGMSGNQGGGMSNMYPTPYALVQEGKMPPNERIRRAMEMEGVSNDGGSYIIGSYGRSYNQASYGDGRSNENGMSSARRGRDGDGDGRYSERSYRDAEMSRDASRKKMVQKLETLMDDTMSEKERNAIQDCIDKIQP